MRLNFYNLKIAILNDHDLSRLKSRDILDTILQICRSHEIKMRGKNEPASFQLQDLRRMNDTKSCVTTAFLLRKRKYYT